MKLRRTRRLRKATKNRLAPVTAEPLRCTGHGPRHRLGLVAVTARPVPVTSTFGGLGLSMDLAQLPLFSARGLAVLNRQVFDPAARGHYEFLSGGLMWPDEFPRPGTAEWAEIAPGHAYRFLLACRAAITLGVARADSAPIWDQVMRGAPDWPGLRPERRGDRARRRLQAGFRIRDKCLADCE